MTRRRLPASEPASGARHERSRVQIVPRRSVLIPLAAWLATCLALPVAAPTAAAEADFYAGKSIALLVGFSAGGGYDLYARTLARHMGRHIPGNPKLIPQNMPGAGSLKAVNYLYNVAPKDGTTIAAFAPGVVFEPLLGRSEGTQFAAPSFTWLGSISQEVSVCAFIKAAGIRTWRDMQTKSYVIGASGGGAESDVFPNVLRKLFNLPPEDRHRLSGWHRDHPGHGAPRGGRTMRLVVDEPAQPQQGLVGRQADRHHAADRHGEGQGLAERAADHGPDR